jgi:hypothetical protein
MFFSQIECVISPQADRLDSPNSGNYRARDFGVREEQNIQSKFVIDGLSQGRVVL